MEQTKKPVGILLRVSTTMQVTAQQEKEADIPTQRAACMRFIQQHPDWELAQEYIEIGVSGYKNSVAQRDKLKDLRDDIFGGRIRVLVVFMFDRLGRQNELPLLVSSFGERGCEVWSVEEGQMKFDGHIDELLNFITFWSAGGESKKISARVTNSMNQMAEQGLYTGGRVPYGYKTVETGRLTKKQLMEKTLAIAEEEAEVVRQVFDLAISHGYGSRRIARELNEAGIYNRSGNQWSNSALSHMLNNPIYKGLKAYNRTTGKGRGKGQKRLPMEQWILPAQPNPDWVIVPAEDWERVNRQKREVVHQQQEQQMHNKSLPGSGLSRSKLLFGGFAYCGVCGAKMSTGYSPYRWTTQDGVTHRKENPVYRCAARSSGKVGCTAKASYSKTQVEAAVLQEILGYLGRLPPMNPASEIRTLRRKATQGEERRIQALRRELEKGEQERSGLEQEILKVIAGESALPREMLGEMLEKNQTREHTLREDLHRAEKELAKRSEAQTELPQRDEVPPWSQVFKEATVDEQKVFLSQLIERVEVSPGDIHVHLRLSGRKFLSTSGKHSKADDR